MEIDIPIPGTSGSLKGDLQTGTPGQGVVIFCHGSGSSRFSPRNRAVAAALNEGSFATLLFDLLTDAEAADRANVFDIPLLGERVVAAIDRVREEKDVATLPLGLFGASTGAAAALVGAAERPEAVSAVVSRGGRPDLARDHLKDVRCPTLLIVGGADREVLMLNEQALAALGCEKALSIVPGATHLFEEPGALDEVVNLAAEWFQQSFETPLP